MFDYENEDEVLAAMAEELDIPDDQLRIEEDNSGWREGGTIYRITTHGGRKEWMVAEGDDEAEALAKEIVEQDLETQPEIFEQSWLKGQINVDRLRRDLEQDVRASNDDYLTELAADDADGFWRLAGEYGIWEPEPDEDDEDWESPEPDELIVEDVSRRKTEEELRDPMAYLEDIYGDEARKRAIEIAGIDVAAAAADAVSIEGAGHFLAGYDGELREGPHGMVYWRVY